MTIIQATLLFTFVLSALLYGKMFVLEKNGLRAQIAKRLHAQHKKPIKRLAIKHIYGVCIIFVSTTCVNINRVDKTLREIFCLKIEENIKTMEKFKVFY